MTLAEKNWTSTDEIRLLVRTSEAAECPEDVQGLIAAVMIYVEFFNGY